MLLAGFVLHAVRLGGQALVDVQLFRVRSFAAAAGVITLASGVMFGALGLLPLYYQQVRGEGALHTGLLLIPLGLGMGASLILVGRLADRFAPAPIVAAGLALGAAGALGYTQLAPDTSYLALGLAQLASGRHRHRAGAGDDRGDARPHAGCDSAR